VGYPPLCCSVSGSSIIVGANPGTVRILVCPLLSDGRVYGLALSLVDHTALLRRRSAIILLILSVSETR